MERVTERVGSTRTRLTIRRKHRVTLLVAYDGYTTYHMIYLLVRSSSYRTENKRITWGTKRSIISRRDRSYTIYFSYYYFYLMVLFLSLSSLFPSLPQGWSRGDHRRWDDIREERVMIARARWFTWHSRSVGMLGSRYPSFTILSLSQHPRLSPSVRETAPDWGTKSQELERYEWEALSLRILIFFQWMIWGCAHLVYDHNVTLTIFYQSLLLSHL